MARATVSNETERRAWLKTLFDAEDDLRELTKRHNELNAKDTLTEAEQREIANIRLGIRDALQSIRQAKRQLERLEGTVSNEHDSWNTPRTVSAAATGVATGLLGGVIPVVGVTAGLILQLLEPTNPQLQRFKRVTEGVVDGSAALIGLALFR